MQRNDRIIDTDTQDNPVLKYLDDEFNAIQEAERQLRRYKKKETELRDQIKASKAGLYSVLISVWTESKNSKSKE